jgi:hypothetical protein
MSSFFGGFSYEVFPLSSFYEGFIIVLSTCYRTVCSLDSRWMKRGQTGVTEPIPPTVTSMGRFFLFMKVWPGGDVPGDLGF